MCEETAVWCKCILTKDHEEPHKCKCGAKWTSHWHDNTFKVVTFLNPEFDDE